MRKVTLKIALDVTLNINEGISIPLILEGMEVVLKDTTGKVDVEDATISDFEVLDSR